MDEFSFNQPAADVGLHFNASIQRQGKRKESAILPPSPDAAWQGLQLALRMRPAMTYANPDMLMHGMECGMYLRPNDEKSMQRIYNSFKTAVDNTRRPVLRKPEYAPGWRHAAKRPFEKLPR